MISIKSRVIYIDGMSSRIRGWSNIIRDFKIYIFKLGTITEKRDIF